MGELITFARVVVGVIREASLFTFLALVVLTVSSGKWTWFNFHPLLMSVAYFLLARAVVAVQRKDVLLEKVCPEDRVGAHGASAFLGITAGAIGGSVVYFYKTVNKIPHYQTPHSLLGAATFAMLLIQFAVGVAFTKTKVFGSRSALICRFHRVSGAIVMALATATSILGWSEIRSDNVQPIGTASLILALLSIAALLNWDDISKLFRQSKNPVSGAKGD